MRFLLNKKRKMRKNINNISLLFISFFLIINNSFWYTNAEIKEATEQMIANWATAQDIAAAANAFWVSASQMDSALWLDSWTADSYMAPPNEPTPSYTPPYWEPPISTPEPAPVEQVLTNLNGESITVQQWADWMQEQAEAWMSNEEIAKIALAAWYTVNQIAEVANNFDWINLNTQDIANLVEQNIIVTSAWDTITVQQWADWIDAQLDAWFTPEMIASTAYLAWYDVEAINIATQLLINQNADKYSDVWTITEDNISDLVWATWSYDWVNWIIWNNWTVSDWQWNILWTLDLNTWIFSNKLWEAIDIFDLDEVNMNFTLPWWEVFSVDTDGHHNYDMAKKWAELAMAASMYWVNSEKTINAFNEYNTLIYTMMHWTTDWYNVDVNYAWLYQDSSWAYNYWCINNSDFMTFIPAPNTWLYWYEVNDDADTSSVESFTNLLDDTRISINPIALPNIKDIWITQVENKVSCNYISWWEEDWTDCNINSSWTDNWTITCKQVNKWKKNETYFEWKQIDIYKDWEIFWSNVNWACPQNITKPMDTENIVDIYISKVSPTANCSGKYANNSDTCSIFISIRWNTIDNKDIIWLEWENIKNITDKSNEWSNRIDWSWKALNFSWVNDTNIVKSWTNYSIIINNIKSVSPFISNNGKLMFTLDSKDILVENIYYNFKKPLIWEIKASNDLWNNWNALPSIGNNLLYNIIYKNVWYLAWLSNYNITNNNYIIDAANNNLSIQNFNIDQNDFSKFTARIDTSINDMENLPVAWIKLSNINISYNLWWEYVKYNLTASEDVDINSSISLTWNEFLWVKVIWNLEWDWKQIITWQRENFSDLSKLETRTNIRKKAYLSIKWLNHNSITNWVRYVEGEDVYINWEQHYETLIVKNGNVIINWNLNELWKKLWIITLTDWYNVTTDHSKTWNIYIDNNVSFINALIYADGWLISYYDWNVLYEDTIERTYRLQKQLIIKWSIFSRNTIGGSILSGWTYILPWWKETNNFNNSMVYDLNYLRRWRGWWDWWDTNWDWNYYNNWYSNPLIIKYDSQLLLNPPKVFK